MKLEEKYFFRIDGDYEPSIEDCTITVSDNININDEGYLYVTIGDDNNPIKVRAINLTTLEIITKPHLVFNWNWITGFSWRYI